jgi:site-specific DNA-methyltransferase (adenine-specific)
MIQLFNGDCLEVMKELPDNSIDFILTDLPYGTTQCKWDNIIPYEPMWAELKRIRKDNTAIALFGTEPFSSHLRLSNLKEYKYDWIWDKKIPSGMGIAKIQPMRKTELISIFINGKSFYYPQMVKRDKPIKAGGNKKTEIQGKGFKGDYKKTYTHKFPMNLIIFDKVRRNNYHLTQKPTELLEYLIKTYTKENEVVLDFTMGSGSTGVACANTKRNFIGIELDRDYFDISENRIQEASKS